LAYEFVEAFSSVVPSVRVSQLLAILGVIVDITWWAVSRNFMHASFIDIPAAILVGYYAGKRPKTAKSDREKKSKWIRLS
jgi:steroid 5-alpha reductase family enzyme